jgi:hypothetical protein
MAPAGAMVGRASWIETPSPEMAVPAQKTLRRNSKNGGDVAQTAHTGRLSFKS